MLRTQNRRRLSVCGAALLLCWGTSAWAEWEAISGFRNCVQDARTLFFRACGHGNGGVLGTLSSEALPEHPVFLMFSRQARYGWVAELHWNTLLPLAAQAKITFRTDSGESIALVAINGRNDLDGILQSISTVFFVPEVLLQQLERTTQFGLLLEDDLQNQLSAKGLTSGLAEARSAYLAQGGNRIPAG